MNSRQIFTSLAALSIALGTAACGGGAEEEAVVEAPEGPEGVTVTDGWMSLPAVAGNPGAVYFTIANASENQASIKSADVMGASSAMLHETAEWEGKMDMQELFTVPVMAGETTVFAPGGRHVMAMAPGADLVAGGETEVTLTFVGGDKLSFPVTLYASGEMPEGAEAVSAEDDAS